MKSALFVDFDNVYSGLRKLDPEIAERFARQPMQWLDWLVESLEAPTGATDSTRRRVLVRRCYFNPQVYQRFRPAFNRAGFEVIDCPAMTSEGKTSTDIHMVLDIVELLQHSVHYDEFVVFSADADFTPVLRKLRRWDRRTTVLAVGFPSAAYQASADLLINQDEFIRQALGFVDEDEIVNDMVRDMVQEASIGKAPPALVATPSSKLKQPSPMQAPAQGRASGKPAKAYADAAAQAEWATIDKGLVEIARQIHDATGYPLLSPGRYRLLFETLVADVVQAPFHLSDTGKRVRDRCKEAAQPVSRADVNTVLRGLLVSGHGFGEGADNVSALANRTADNLLALCRREQLPVDERFEGIVRQWVGADPREGAPAAA